MQIGEVILASSKPENAGFIMLQQRGLSDYELDEYDNDEDADEDAPRRHGNFRVMGSDATSESIMNRVPLHMAQTDLSAKAGVILVRHYLLFFRTKHSRTKRWYRE
jgi:hypothetical protein